MIKLLKLLFSRMVIVGILIFFQVATLVLLIWNLSNQFAYVYGIFVLLSLLIVVWMFSKDDNPSVKLPWVVVIMLFPIFGGLFYIFFGSSKISKRFRVDMDKLLLKTYDELPSNPTIFEEIQQLDKRIASQNKYIQKTTHMPVYKHTSSEYLALGEIKLKRLTEELEKAQHFIFLHYFIIQEGVMWNTILDILERKAKQGLDVRVMYDDVGCLQTLPSNYNQKLEQKGIKCVVFNPFRPTINVALQNRDHRKIAVIDGHTGFTGGINLADEYINAYKKHGHWKDCAVLLKGEAVWNLTLLFLETWNFYRPIDDNYACFKPHFYHTEPFESDGYIQPYGDTPLDNEYVGESVYINLINQATDYLYINTPYFIVDNELVTALTLAAKRGVDVRITTPHIPDKWYVHLITQSYYPVLIEAGIKVYEYTPGFIHSKTFVADDEVATIGTINLDYRSLYHHYECGAWMYKTRAVLELKNDFLSTLEVCTLIHLENCGSLNWFKRCTRSLLKIFAPLM